MWRWADVCAPGADRGLRATGLWRSVHRLHAGHGLHGRAAVLVGDLQPAGAGATLGRGGLRWAGGCGADSFVSRAPHRRASQRRLLPAALPQRHSPQERPDQHGGLSTAGRAAAAFRPGGSLPGRHRAGLDRLWRESSHLHALLAHAGHRQLQSGWVGGFAQHHARLSGVRFRLGLELGHGRGADPLHLRPLHGDASSLRPSFAAWDHLCGHREAHRDGRGGNPVRS